MRRLVNTRSPRCVTGCLSTRRPRPRIVGVKEGELVCEAVFGELDLRGVSVRSYET